MNNISLLVRNFCNLPKFLSKRISAERSSSIYSNILADDRRNIKENNFPEYNLIHKNSDK